MMRRMSGIYQALVTTAGFSASAYYQLSNSDEADERVTSLVESGFLVKIEDDPDADVIEPEVVIKRKRNRTGVPELPEA